MSIIALVGSVTLVLQEATLKKLLLPLVALAAGTLLGGPRYPMIPASSHKLGNDLRIYAIKLNTLHIICFLVGFGGSARNSVCRRASIVSDIF